MKDFEEITVKVKKKMITSVTCNKCGKSEKLIGPIYEREVDAEAFPTVRMSFGYGSNFDGEIWEFELCEDCLVEFTKAFKHPPNVTKYM